KNQKLRNSADQLLGDSMGDDSFAEIEDEEVRQTNPVLKHPFIIEALHKQREVETSKEQLSRAEPLWKDNDEYLSDPELKAEHDQEVEEFRMRLERINTNPNRKRIPLPSTLSSALIES